MTTHAMPKRPRIIPESYQLLANWRYVEYSLLRIICGWGRQACDWQDKLAVCYHAWLQAENVDRLRRRLDQYPGGRPEAPVGKTYESLMNTALLAPDFNHAMHGAHALVQATLTRAYREYLAESHPVHDKPTHEMLRELIANHEIQAKWFANFSQRQTTQYDQIYLTNIQRLLSEHEHLTDHATPADPYAATVGINTEFRQPQTPGRVPHWNEAPNIMPLLQTRWSESVEVRRLFFMIGYFWEMGVAEQQLRWLYYADFMPWQFIYEEARHMWDESRHGNSGLTRLRDFGIDIKDIGYSSYDKNGDGLLPHMTPADLYEEFFGITQVAETGYFETKRYCFEDFANGNDAASAEMMQYDIIDETAHVEYGRKWLEELARRAGIQDDYRIRGAERRHQRQHESDERVRALKHFLAHHELPADYQPESANAIGGLHGDLGLDALTSPTARTHLEKLLQILRVKCPLANAASAAKRPNLPM